MKEWHTLSSARRPTCFEKTFEILRKIYLVIESSYKEIYLWEKYNRARGEVVPSLASTITNLAPNVQGSTIKKSID